MSTESSYLPHARREKTQGQSNVMKYCCCKCYAKYEDLFSLTQHIVKNCVEKTRRPLKKEVPKKKVVNIENQQVCQTQLYGHVKNKKCKKITCEQKNYSFADQEYENGKGTKDDEDLKEIHSFEINENLNTKQQRLITKNTITNKKSDEDKEYNTKIANTCGEQDIIRKIPDSETKLETEDASGDHTNFFIKKTIRQLDTPTINNCFSQNNDQKKQEEIKETQDTNNAFDKEVLIKKNMGLLDTPTINSCFSQNKDQKKHEEIKETKETSNAFEDHKEVLIKETMGKLNTTITHSCSSKNKDQINKEELKEIKETEKTNSYRNEIMKKNLRFEKITQDSCEVPEYLPSIKLKLCIFCKKSFLFNFQLKKHKSKNCKLFLILNEKLKQSFRQKNICRNCGLKFRNAIGLSTHRSVCVRFSEIKKNYRLNKFSKKRVQRKKDRAQGGDINKKNVSQKNNSKVKSLGNNDRSEKQKVHSNSIKKKGNIKTDSIDKSQKTGTLAKRTNNKSETAASGILDNISNRNEKIRKNSIDTLSSTTTSIPIKVPKLVNKNLSDNKTHLEKCQKTAMLEKKTDCKTGQNHNKSNLYNDVHHLEKQKLDISTSKSYPQNSQDYSKSGICDICGFQFDNIQALLRHKKFYCKRFNTQKILENISEKSKPKSSNKFHIRQPAAHCSKNADDLEAKISIKKDNKKDSFKVHGNQFRETAGTSNSNNIKTNDDSIRQQVDISTSKSYPQNSQDYSKYGICDICGFQFVNIQALLRHKKFYCKRFNTQKILENISEKSKPKSSNEFHISEPAAHCSKNADDLEAKISSKNDNKKDSYKVHGNQFRETVGTSNSKNIKTNDDLKTNNTDSSNSSNATVFIDKPKVINRKFDLTGTKSHFKNLKKMVMPENNAKSRTDETPQRNSTAAQNNNDKIGCKDDKNLEKQKLKVSNSTDNLENTQNPTVKLDKDCLSKERICDLCYLQFDDIQTLTRHKSVCCQSFKTQKKENILNSEQKEDQSNVSGNKIKADCSSVGAIENSRSISKIQRKGKIIEVRLTTEIKHKAAHLIQQTIEKGIEKKPTKSNYVCDQCKHGFKYETDLVVHKYKFHKKNDLEVLIEMKKAHSEPTEVKEEVGKKILNDDDKIIKENELNSDVKNVDITKQTEKVKSINNQNIKENSLQNTKDAQCNPVRTEEKLKNIPEATKWTDKMTDKKNSPQTAINSHCKTDPSKTEKKIEKISEANKMTIQKSTETKTTSKDSSKEQAQTSKASGVQEDTRSKQKSANEITNLDKSKTKKDNKTATTSEINSNNKTEENSIQSSEELEIQQKKQFIEEIKVDPKCSGIIVPNKGNNKIDEDNSLNKNNPKKDIEPVEISADNRNKLPTKPNVELDNDALNYATSSIGQNKENTKEKEDVFCLKSQQHDENIKHQNKMVSNVPKSIDITNNNIQIIGNASLLKSKLFEENEKSTKQATEEKNKLLIINKSEDQTTTVSYQDKNSSDVGSSSTKDADIKKLTKLPITAAITDPMEENGHFYRQRIVFDLREKLMKKCDLREKLKSKKQENIDESVSKEDDGGRGDDDIALTSQILQKDDISHKPLVIDEKNNLSSPNELKKECASSKNSAVLTSSVLAINKNNLKEITKELTVYQDSAIETSTAVNKEKTSVAIQPAVARVYNKVATFGSVEDQKFKIYCEKCGISIRDINDLENPFCGHKKTLFPCPLCKINFSNINQLISHQDKTHKLEEVFIKQNEDQRKGFIRWYHCCHCGEGFNFLKNLIIHKASKHKFYHKSTNHSRPPIIRPYQPAEKIYACVFCNNKPFASLELLLAHEETSEDHKRNEREFSNIRANYAPIFPVNLEHVCYICRLDFKSFKNQQIHMLTSYQHHNLEKKLLKNPHFSKTVGPKLNLDVRNVKAGLKYPSYPPKFMEHVPSTSNYPMPAPWPHPKHPEVYPAAIVDQPNKYFTPNLDLYHQPLHIQGFYPTQLQGYSPSKKTFLEMEKKYSEPRGSSFDDYYSKSVPIYIPDSNKKKKSSSISHKEKSSSKNEPQPTKEYSTPSAIEKSELYKKIVCALNPDLRVNPSTTSIETNVVYSNCTSTTNPISTLPQKISETIVDLTPLNTLMNISNPVPSVRDISSLKNITSASSPDYQIAYSVPPEPLTSSVASILVSDDPSDLEKPFVLVSSDDEVEFVKVHECYVCAESFKKLKDLDNHECSGPF